MMMPTRMLSSSTTTPHSVHSWPNCHRFTMAIWVMIISTMPAASPIRPPCTTRGSVLNIGSVNAWSGEPNLLPYSVSKGALMTLTRNLGDTLMREDGVRVNQINPGWVLTENEAQRKRDHGLSDDWYKDLPKVYAPAGRILWPEEIAAAAVYWLADESGPISGQVVDLEQHPFIGRNPPKDSTTEERMINGCETELNRVTRIRKMRNRAMTKARDRKSCASC